MPKTIQIRNVPDELHHRIKLQAAQTGRSLSEYLLGELRQMAMRSTRQEMFERLRQRRSVKPKVSPAKAVRDKRERK